MLKSLLVRSLIFSNSTFKLLEKSETKYDQYDSKIFALQDRFVGIENSLREFKDLPKKPKPKRKRAPRKGRSRNTIISIVKDPID